MRIGLFDSGVGGLTVLRALFSQQPHAEIIYLGDTARTPYGIKSAETIRRYAQECTAFLLQYDIDLLVVACNTVSAYALDLVQEVAQVHVIGTIEPAVNSVLQLSSGSSSTRVGIIGTEATISSRVYQDKLKAELPGVALLSQSCPLFVPLVEEGILSGPLLDEAVKFYLANWRNQVDIVILGCTHYPVIKAAIQRGVGEQVRLVECSTAIAGTIRDLTQGLPKKGVLLEKQLSLSSSLASYKDNEAPAGALNCYVTDEVDRFQRVAARFLGTELASKMVISRIDLNAARS